jgi:cytoskeletal protein CcmA (bactofilin family)
MEKSGQSAILKGVEITGTIKSEGPIRIDGKLDGEVFCQADVVVGKDAVIKGNVRSTSVVVEGAITGNITAKDKIDMKATARVTGDIQSKRLSVEDGVTFVGKSEVNPAGAVAAGAEPPKVTGKPPEKVAVTAR